MPNRVRFDGGAERVFADSVDDETAAVIAEGFARLVPAPGANPKLDAIMKRLLNDLTARQMQRSQSGVMTEALLLAYSKPPLPG